MWCLVIMLLASVPGLDTVTVLRGNLTEHTCQRMRSQVGFEMAAAYPYERDFEIVCRAVSVL